MTYIQVIDCSGTMHPTNLKLGTADETWFCDIYKAHTVMITFGILQREQKYFFQSKRAYKIFNEIHRTTLAVMSLSS